MSKPSIQPHGHHEHAHDSTGHDHGSYRSYLTGFVLAAILTIIPFAIVMSGG
ncbi:MAG: cytochrome o ubiquinol oxidase subunit IV, partial [Allorhizobium sp.]